MFLQKKLAKRIPPIKIAQMLPHASKDVRLLSQGVINAQAMGKCRKESRKNTLFLVHQKWQIVEYNVFIIFFFHNKHYHTSALKIVVLYLLPTSALEA